MKKSAALFFTLIFLLSCISTGELSGQNLQKLINEASDGSVIELESRDYKFDEILKIEKKSNLVIRGQAQTKWIWKKDMSFINLIDSDNIIFESIYFQYQANGTATAIQVSRSQKIHIKTCQVDRAYFGIALSDCEDIRLEEFSVTHCHTAIKVKHSKKLELINSRFLFNKHSITPYYFKFDVAKGNVAQGLLWKPVLEVKKILPAKKVSTLNKSTPSQQVEENNAAARIREWSYSSDQKQAQIQPHEHNEALNLWDQVKQTIDEYSLPSLNKIVQLNPYLKEAHLARIGVLKAMAIQGDDLLKAYENYLEIYTNDYKLLIEYGEELLSTNYPLSAIPILKSGISLLRKDRKLPNGVERYGLFGKAHLALARSHKKLKQPRSADEKYQSILNHEELKNSHPDLVKIVELEKNGLKTLLETTTFAQEFPVKGAQKLRSLGQLDEAEKLVQETIAKSPNDLAAKELLVALALDRWDITKAEKILKQYSKEFKLWKKRGDYLRRIKHVKGYPGFEYSRPNYVDYRRMMISPSTDGPFWWRSQLFRFGILPKGFVRGDYATSPSVETQSLMRWIDEDNKEAASTLAQEILAKDPVNPVADYWRIKTGYDYLLKRRNAKIKPQKEEYENWPKRARELLWRDRPSPWLRARVLLFIAECEFNAATSYSIPKELIPSTEYVYSYFKESLSAFHSAGLKFPASAFRKLSGISIEMRDLKLLNWIEQEAVARNIYGTGSSTTFRKR